MKDDKTTPVRDLTPRADGDVTDSGSSLHSKRRTLLKRTGTVTATAALATWLLPKQWQKPAIDVVGLPLHAQTSPAVVTTAATTGATTTEATTTRGTTTEATTTRGTTTEATTTEATTTEATTTEATTTGEPTTTAVATTTVATTTVATTTAAPRTMVTEYTVSQSGRSVIHDITLMGPVPVADGDLSLEVTFGEGIMTVTMPTRTLENLGAGSMTAANTQQIGYVDRGLPTGVIGAYTSVLSSDNENVVVPDNRKNPSPNPLNIE